LHRSAQIQAAFAAFFFFRQTVHELLGLCYIHVLNGDTAQRGAGSGPQNPASFRHLKPNNTRRNHALGLGIASG
jgi:hypothetical protein